MDKEEKRKVRVCASTKFLELKFHLMDIAFTHVGLVGFCVRVETIEELDPKRAKMKKGVKFPEFQFTIDPLHCKFVRQTHEGECTLLFSFQFSSATPTGRSPSSRGSTS